MEFERCGYSQSELMEYTQLFSTCFPDARKLADSAYLRWLYVDNPSGAVVGFNARDAGRLAAHYVCVPMSVFIEGAECRVLLSLNTATHPDYQGKGLFTRLAELTYAAGAEAGFDFVYGVANENSTPGFLRKLGFALISPLQSRVGIGPLGEFDWSKVPDCARFRHAWTRESLAWRIANPVAPIMRHRARNGALGFSAPAGRIGFRAWAELPDIGGMSSAPLVAASLSLRVWLGLLPTGLGALRAYAELPGRLRPSPLNLILRSLQRPLSIRSDEVFFNFLDFDAF